MTAEGVPDQTAASAAPAHARLEAAKPGSPKGVAGLAGPLQRGDQLKLLYPSAAPTLQSEVELHEGHQSGAWQDLLPRPSLRSLPTRSCTDNALSGPRQRQC